MNKNLSILLISALSLTIAACLTVDQENATATAKAGGPTDRAFLEAEATEDAKNGFFNDEVLIFDATSTAEAGGFDGRLSTATAEAVEIERSIAAESTVFAQESDATSTAEAIELATATGGTPPARQVLRNRSASSATATPAPDPTSLPAPTATPVPVPTPTEVPVIQGPWITALQAIRNISNERDGAVGQVVAHVSKQAGEIDSGDLTSDTPSPGAGYAAIWEVTMVDGDDLFFCQVWMNGHYCDPSRFVEPGDVGGSAKDSPDALARWAGTPEWDELMRKEDISILAVLKPSAGEGSALLWQLTVTVHNATEGLRGGNFNWVPATDETSFTTY